MCASQRVSRTGGCFVEPSHGIESSKWAIFGKQNWRCGMNRKPGYGAQLRANLEPTKDWLTGALKPKRVNSSLQYACPSVRLASIIPRKNVNTWLDDGKSSQHNPREGPAC
ncbi:unnamed protein product [Brassica napus]|uniref:(rape) hypothetical protein n=1 Tax=Brassica napus TaxID=3708 RepID=A0A816SJD3_BRANA|nr:unnamed protein product [Brassica napus]